MSKKSTNQKYWETRASKYKSNYKLTTNYPLIKQLEILQLELLIYIPPP